MKYDYIFFDLDGTLSDTFLGITNAVVYTFGRLGEPIPDKSVIRSFIGPPLSYSFGVICGFSNEKTEIATNYFREYYEKDGWRECTLFDGMNELLRSLKEKGNKLAVATSKNEAFARPLLEMLGVYGYFDFVAASNDEVGRTSKSDVIEYAISTLSLDDPARVLMVGDTRFDIEGANEKGLDSVGVLFGFGTRESLEEEGATYIAETVSDLLELLESFN